MKIYTYYETVPQLSAYDELKLLQIWRRYWHAAGFEPWTISEFEARSHPMFDEYDQAISKLPSCNPAHYERACWMRWLALAEVGGGLMADYDVLPYSNVEAVINPVIDSKLGTLIMFQERAPSLIYCNDGRAINLCIEFATGKYGSRPQGDKPHFSDQYAIEDLVAGKADWIEVRDDVKGYMDEGWEKAPFVHYSTGSMQPRGKIPRWRHVTTLRSQ